MFKPFDDWADRYEAFSIKIQLLSAELITFVWVFSSVCCEFNEEK